MTKRVSTTCMILVMVIAATVMNAMAEPTTGDVRIIQIRLYNLAGSSGDAQIEVDRVSVCDTNLYRVNFAFVNSKEVYAAALAAFLADMKVRIEVVNSGCTGWGTYIQSIYIHR